MRPADPNVSPALECRRLTKTYGGGRIVLDALDFALGAGEFVAIMGDSGVGKSTLLNLIAGFETPDTGDVMLRGKIINTVAPNRRNVAMVFQNYALFPHMTVAGIIAYGLKARGVPKAEWRPRVAEAIALLNLTGFDERYPAQLSGGQRQRVAVAEGEAAEAVPLGLVLPELAMRNLVHQLRLHRRKRWLDRKLQFCKVFL
jgi:putative ABC transport system ATP-binding protein